MQVAAYQHGIYPRSEELIQATRDFERGRTTKDAVAAQVRADEREYIAVQDRAGLDYVSDGMLRFQDIFRPIAEASPGMQAGGLIRWFDNNSFFRTPEITGPVAMNGELPRALAEAEKVSGPRIATLPSPYAFSRAATTRGDRDTLMTDIAREVIKPIASRLSAGGVELIHLAEPWLGFFGIDEPSFGALERSIGEITEGLRAKVVLHVYFGDCAAYADRLKRLPLHAVGVDFLESDLDQLGGGWETGIAAGVVNGRVSGIEEVASVVEFSKRIIERLNPAAFYLTSNSELELLPRKVAKEKVLRLGECSALVKDSIS